MATDLDSLMQLVRWYYPPGMEADDPRYRKTEQARRLQALLDGVARDMGLVERFAVGLQPVPDEVLELGATARELRQWPVFIGRLKEEFAGCTIWNRTIPHQDPSYVCQIFLSKVSPGSGYYDAVVCLLSLLAPVYAIYGIRDIDKQEHWLRFPPLPEEYQEHETRLAALIEAEFGFTRLSKEVLLTPIPDLVPPLGTLLLGEAKLIDCLFNIEHPDE